MPPCMALRQWRQGQKVVPRPKTWQLRRINSSQAKFDPRCVQYRDLLNASRVKLRADVVPMLRHVGRFWAHVGPMLAHDGPMLGPFWAMLTQIWQLSRWFYVTLKNVEKHGILEQKCRPKLKLLLTDHACLEKTPRHLRCGQISQGWCLVVSAFNEIHCSQQPSPGRMVHQQSCNDGLLGIFDRVLSSYPYPERGSLLEVGILRLKKCWPININHRLHRKHAIPTVGIASQHFALLFQSYASLAALAASSWASATRWPSLTTLRLQGSSEQRAVHRCWSSALLLMWESRGKPTMNHPEFSKKQMVYTQFAVLFGTEIQSL